MAVARAETQQRDGLGELRIPAPSVVFRSIANSEIAISGLKLKVPHPPSGFAAALQINSTPWVLGRSDDGYPTKSTLLRSVSASVIFESISVRKSLSAAPHSLCAAVERRTCDRLNKTDRLARSRAWCSTPSSYPVSRAERVFPDGRRRRPPET